MSSNTEIKEPENTVIVKMEFNLNIQERMNILQTLPADGKFLYAKILKDFIEKCGLTEQEFKDYVDDTNPLESKIRETGIYYITKVDVPETILRKSKAALSDLEKQKKLRLHQLSLYEKIIEPPNTEPISIKRKLNITERIILRVLIINVAIPVEGNYLYLKSLSELDIKLSLTEVEKSKYIDSEKSTKYATVTNILAKDYFVTVPIQVDIAETIREVLVDLDEADKVTPNMVTLYEKFVGNKI